MKKSKKNHKPRREMSELLTISGISAAYDDPLPGVPKPWEPSAKLGLSLLSVGSVAAIHAGFNPSLAGLRLMAQKPEEKTAAQRGLWWSLGVSLAAATGLWFLFSEKLPAYAAGTAGIVFFGLGMVSLSGAAPATAGMGDVG